jgi:hypothetical protein
MSPLPGHRIASSNADGTPELARPADLGNLERPFGPRSWHVRRRRGRENYARQDSNPPDDPSGKQHKSTQRGTESGTPADATGLEALAAALLGLSAVDRTRLAALVARKESGDPKPGAAAPDAAKSE